MSDIAALFKSVRLPVMSEVAHALIRSLHDKDATIAQVRDIIAKDPTLTAKLLRAANSAGIGLRREISTLDNAIAMLGMSQVRTLALTACMNISFPTVAGLNRAEFWRNSMACAGYAEWLTAGLGLGLDEQRAWLTGMMARLGELLIGQNAPASLVEIEKLPHMPGERWKREQLVLGFTETQVTAELARRWHFPAEIVRGLDTASDPLAAQPFCPLGAIVHLAGWLADMPFNAPVVIDALPDEVITSLDLNREWMRENMPQPDAFFDISGL